MFFGPFQLTSGAQIWSKIPPSLWQQCKGSISTFLTVWPIFHRDPSRARFFSAIKRMPRKKGLVNYKNNLLINIIEEILPNGKLGWEAIVIAYQGRLNKEAQQGMTNIKKHWIKNLCNGMRKLTGHTGENGDRVCRCIAIKKKIIKKTHLDS
jgi:hypothetical protein